MVIRFFVLTTIILSTNLLLADPTSLSRLLCPENASLSFIFEQHNKNQVSTTDTDKIIEILKHAEEIGEPFHVLVEQTSPLKKIINPHERSLLIDLIARAKDELQDTIIENIENRKVSAIAETLLNKALWLQLIVEIAHETSPVHQEIPAYVGKTLKELTLQDVLTELESLLGAAAQVTARYHADAYLYSNLTDHLHNALEKMHLLRTVIAQKNIDIHVPLLTLSKEAAAEMHSHIQGPRDYLFDFNALDRVLGLLGLSKKNLLIIAGADHDKTLIRILTSTKRFHEVISLPQKGAQQGKVLTPEQLSALALSLESYYYLNKKNHQDVINTCEALTLAYETVTATAKLLLGYFS